ncbi:ribonuclease H-like domain-containing protein [Tanacetum coccineum]
MQQPMPNPEDITDPIAAMNMALALMAKEFKLNYSTPTNNNQRVSSNPQNRQIAQPVQNPGGQNVRNQNRVIVIPGIANQNRNGNVVAARAEGNANGTNGNQIRCYNCRGLGHLARNCSQTKKKGCNLSSDSVVDCSKGRSRNPTQASTSST